MKASESVWWGAWVLLTAGLGFVITGNILPGLALAGGGIVGIGLSTIIWMCERDPP